MLTCMGMASRRTRAREDLRIRPGLTLRRTENADTAEAIMQYMKKGERAGYFRIAANMEKGG